MKNALLYHFLANLLAHNKKMTQKSVLRKAQSPEMTLQSFPVPVKFFVIFEEFTRAYLFQNTLEIIWLPIKMALLNGIRLAQHISLSEHGDLLLLLFLSKQCLAENIQENVLKKSSATLVFEESPRACITRQRATRSCVTQYCLYYCFKTAGNHLRQKRINAIKLQHLQACR